MRLKDKLKPYKITKGSTQNKAKELKMKMDDEIHGALKRILREVKEYRKAECLMKDCIVNRQIGGNDIQLVESWITKE